MVASVLKESGIPYVKWALNWIRGCGVNCSYCYMRSIADRFNLVPAGGWDHPEKRFQDPVGALRRQLKGWKPDAGRIIVSSSHDPSCPEVAGIVEVLVEAGLADRTMILSKRPMQLLSYLQGAGAKEGLLFGTSVTSYGDDAYKGLEPGSESPVMREAALEAALDAGYKLWISLEPPLPGYEIHNILRSIKLEALDFPWVVMGKLNYRGKDENLAGWDRGHKWGPDLSESLEYLRDLKYSSSIDPQSRRFYVKPELSKELHY